MNIVAPESLIFWTTITFIILLVLLRKFAWKPILGAVKGREDSINSALESAEKAKLEMQNLKADNEKLLQEARTERESMIKEAREIRKKMIAEAEEDTKERTTAMIAQAQEAIVAEKRAAVSELKNQVAELSLEIAEKVVKAELSDKGKQEQLVDRMLQDATLN
ncbi:MAG TPA: F0F1 ATP synthase subunit B [Leeuwenhoekiella sp.]|nr:F0F1 ATP synthase subunit B [Leeuwenhoekiella sp.]